MSGPRFMELNASQAEFWKQHLNQERRARSAFAKYDHAAPAKLRRGHGPHAHRVTCIAPTLLEESDDFVLNCTSLDGAGQRIRPGRPMGVRLDHGGQPSRQDAMNPLVNYQSTPKPSPTTAAAAAAAASDGNNGSRRTSSKTRSRGGPRKSDTIHEIAEIITALETRNPSSSSLRCSAQAEGKLGAIRINKTMPPLHGCKREQSQRELSGSGIIAGGEDTRASSSSSKHKSEGEMRRGDMNLTGGGSGLSAAKQLRGERAVKPPTKSISVCLSHRGSSASTGRSSNSPDSPLRRLNLLLPDSSTSSSAVHSVSSKQRSFIETHQRLSNLEQAFHSHKTSTDDMKDQVAEVKELLMAQLLPGRD